MPSELSKSKQRKENQKDFEHFAISNIKGVSLKTNSTKSCPKDCKPVTTGPKDCKPVLLSGDEIICLLGKSFYKKERQKEIHSKGKARTVSKKESI